MKTKSLKKIISFIVAVSLVITLFAGLPTGVFNITASAETVTSGMTGDCTWTLDGTHLTISGNGKMGDYSYSHLKPTAPWGKNITSVTVEQGVTSIGNSAFNVCSILKIINIPDSVTSIGDYAFKTCRSLTSITIPDNVTSIGNFAFEDCMSLTSIAIPDSVTSIGYNAFEDCINLTSVTIGNSVTSIGNEFSYCSKLTSITIPNSVTSIDDYAFYSCTGLTSIIIPDSVTSIGNHAFDCCAGLTSITIPDSVTSIGNWALYNCNNLVIKTPENSVAYKYALENNIDFEIMQSAVKLGDVNGDGVVNLGDAIEVLRHDAKVITLTGTQLAAANVDGNDRVDSNDAKLILQYYAKAIDKFLTE